MKVLLHLGKKLHQHRHKYIQLRIQDCRPLGSLCWKIISVWCFYPDGINNNTSSSFFTDAALVGNPHWLQWHRNRSLALGRDSQIVYNRVPKCGSRTIVDLLRYMGKKQNFTYKHSTTYTEFNLTHEAEERQVGKIFNMMKPTVFDRHMYFINFKK